MTSHLVNGNIDFAMSTSYSSEIVTNLKRVVDAVAKSASADKTTTLQTSEIVKSLRLVLEV